MRRLNVEVPAELRERPVVVAKVALPVAMIEQPKQVPTEKAVDPPKPIESPKAVDKPKPQAPPLSSPASVAVSFDRQIRPIFEAKCNNCHGLKKPKGDLDLRTLAALNKGGTSGPAVKPGDPTMSTLWESVETDRMPPGKAKLTTSERDLVKRWIESGAK